MERTCSYARHRVWDSDGSQTAATSERIFSNALHGVGDIDGSQIFATSERTMFNALHGVGDDAYSIFNFVFHKNMTIFLYIVRF